MESKWQVKGLLWTHKPCDLINPYFETVIDRDHHIMGIIAFVVASVHIYIRIFLILTTMS